MKNWPLILERAIEDVNEAFCVTVTEYGRGGRSSSRSTRQVNHTAHQT